MKVQSGTRAAVAAVWWHNDEKMPRVCIKVSKMCPNGRLKFFVMIINGFR